MKKQVVAMMLAGGRVDELSVLTAKRPKSAVPIWGMYRFIDFALSNMMHSGIDVVGVLAQYRPYSLSTHLANGAPWDYLGRTRELRILSPYKGATDSDWYKGTADAVYQNLNFIRRYEPEMVLIASGDHVVSMDYRPMIRQHLATGADLTIAVKRVPHDMAPSFGTAVLDQAGRVVEYEEKARRPKSDLASLTVYVFRFSVLAERLRENAAEGRSHQIYSEVIPAMVRNGAAVHGYLFEGYWQYARTLDAYYAANMDIVGPDAPDLAAWQVRTNLEGDGVGDPPPALFRRRTQARGALIGPAATVAGTIERSVISPGVVIAPGATVRDSVVMHSCRIERGATIDRAILDKGVVVGAGARVGAGDPAPNERLAASLTCGVTVVGKGARVPPDYEIGRNCVIAPELVETAFPSGATPSGSMVVP
ncbi:MAG: glucose-1-phosphate adenylyltransferase family protein [Acidobacteriota bacterium]